MITKHWSWKVYYSMKNCETRLCVVFLILKIIFLKNKLREHEKMMNFIKNGQIVNVVNFREIWVSWYWLFDYCIENYIKMLSIR